MPQVDRGTRADHGAGALRALVRAQGAAGAGAHPRQARRGGAGDPGVPDARRRPRCRQGAEVGRSPTPRTTSATMPTSWSSIAAYADEGPTLKRWRARARGRVNRIRKRTCHITITVSPALPGEIKPRRERPVRPRRPTEAPPAEPEAVARSRRTRPPPSRRPRRDGRGRRREPSPRPRPRSPRPRSAEAEAEPEAEPEPEAERGARSGARARAAEPEPPTDEPAEDEREHRETDEEANANGP